MSSGHSARDGAPGALTVSPAYAPRKRAGVLEIDLGDGVVLYDPESSLVHHLNPSASIIWTLAEGEARVAQLATEIAEEFRMDRQAVEEQVVALVAELDALGLVEDATAGTG